MQDVIEVNGETYTKQKPAGAKKIFVLPSGFVFVGHERDNGDGMITITQCHNVRKWDKGGLGGLTMGAKSSQATLDKSSDITVSESNIIFRAEIPVDWSEI